MKTIMITLLVFLLSILACSTASPCTDSCNERHRNRNGMIVTFCGNDNNTYTIHWKELLLRCYRTECKITSMYPGPCGCPNYCSESSGQGKCEDKTCVCNEGFAGPDCSSIVCPNNCSGNGICKEDKQHNYCACNEGWTYHDCSIPIPQLENKPFDNLFPNDRPFYANDKYEDKHPVFNVSTVATLKVDVSPEDFAYLLNVDTSFNQTYVKANVWYQNGEIVETIKGAGLKLKGFYTRTLQKKGWNLKFTAFKKGKLFGLKKVGLKGIETTYAKNLLVNDYLRSMNVPSTRSSYVRLWINSYDWGLYWIMEDIGSKFLKSRYENSTGNFYECGLHGFLEERDSPKAYQDATITQHGGTKHIYQQKEGNGCWDDFMNLISVLHHTSDREFEHEIVKIFNVERFLRAQVVENAVFNWDGYARNGNNYGLYWNPSGKRFEYIVWDFDFTYDNSRAAVYWWSSGKAVLFNRIMEVESYRLLYKSYYEKFLDTVWMTDKHSNRISSLEKFLIPAAKTDLVYVIQNGCHPEELMPDNYKGILSYIDNRYKYVKDHLNAEITWLTAFFAGGVILAGISMLVEKRRKDKIKPVVIYEEVN